jgi:hypothetical protein
VDSIALLDGMLYWTRPAGGLGTVSDCPVAGCSSGTDIATGLTGGTAIAASGADVYFVAAGGMSIFKVPAAGATSQPFPVVGSTQVSSSLAVDGTFVYWTDLGDGGPSAGSIGRAPIDGTSKTILATGQSSPTAIVVDDKSIYWVDIGTSNQKDGTIMRMAK